MGHDWWLISEYCVDSRLIGRGQGLSQPWVTLLETAVVTLQLVEAWKSKVEVTSAWWVGFVLG